MVYDDIRGLSFGHFVVLSGYTKQNRRVQVADPLVPNPMAAGRCYDVDIYRLVCAVMPGILTYDGNLLIIRKNKTHSSDALTNPIPMDGHKFCCDCGRIGLFSHRSAKRT